MVNVSLSTLIATCYYFRELNIPQGQIRNDSLQVHFIFRKLFIRTAVLSVILSVILTVVWPAATTLLGIFSRQIFTAWIYIAVLWAAIATVYVAVVPLWSEISGKYRAFKEQEFIAPENSTISKQQQVAWP